MAVDPWRDRAACRGKPDADWFPDNEKYLSPANELALSICWACPVRQPCLDFAATTETTRGRFGIYGGLLANTRAR